MGLYNHHTTRSCASGKTSVTEVVDIDEKQQRTKNGALGTSEYYRK